MAKHFCPFCDEELLLQMDEALGQVYECPECGFTEEHRH